MKLGIFANAFRGYSLEETLERIAKMGIEMVEFGVGEESGYVHLNPEELLVDKKKLQHVKDLLKNYGLKVSALSTHGNPISPRAAVRDLSVMRMQNAARLCQELEVDTINGFSGCPGDCEGADYASWVVTNWPEDYRRVLEWQWNEKLVPFWQEMIPFAKQYGVEKFALEMHPGFLVYNPKTLKKLRADVGPAIGANLDFSHLLWHRMDPLMVIRELEGCIYHMHAKDMIFDDEEVMINGTLTTVDYPYRRERPFNFRTMGYGHDMIFWKNIFAELRRVGYDYVASIELECDLFNSVFGSELSAEFMHMVLMKDDMNQHDKWLDTILVPGESYQERYHTDNKAARRK